MTNDTINALKELTDKNTAVEKMLADKSAGLSAEKKAFKAERERFAQERDAWRVLQERDRAAQLHAERMSKKIRERGDYEVSLTIEVRDEAGRAVLFLPLIPAD